MKKTTTPPPAVAETETAEARNVAVTIHENRTKIGGAIVAAGPCDFPLTQSEAKALEGLGKATITGLF